MQQKEAVPQFQGQPLISSCQTSQQIAETIGQGIPAGVNQAGEKLFQLHKIFIAAAEIYPDRGDPACFQSMEMREGQLPIIFFFSLFEVSDAGRLSFLVQPWCNRCRIPGKYGQNGQFFRKTRTLWTKKHHKNAIHELFNNS